MWIESTKYTYYSTMYVHRLIDLLSLKFYYENFPTCKQAFNKWLIIKHVQLHEDVYPYLVSDLRTLSPPHSLVIIAQAN